MFYVYVIYNQEQNKIYIGQTENLEKRIEWHNDKIFKNCYTSRYSGNWSLIYKEECKDRKMAVSREKQLKSYRGRQFIKKYIPQ